MGLFAVKEEEEFLYTISHDLNEPLRSIKSFGTFLEEEYGDMVDERGRFYISRMLAAAERMGDMIDGLLELSRVGRDENMSEVDLNEILIEVCAEMDDFIDERNGSVRSSLLPIVVADRKEIKKLFANLIENAMKFNTGPNPRVRVESSRDEEGHTFVFEDNSIPIPAKDRERIFNVFERLHEREKYRGVGIGLAICRKIVECHGGRIWAEGGEEGNRFCFTLPYR